MIHTNNQIPLVSFVIPTHNRSEVLAQCLESCINQTYKNIEIIVINDNSEDSTEEILKEFNSKYKFLKYYNSPGKGASAARNLGIEKALGKYIAFMDDDDICEPFRIEEQMKPIFESNYKYNFIVSGFYIVNSEGKRIETINYLKPLESIGFTVRWLVGKNLLIKAGGFDSQQPNLEEVELFWRLRGLANIYFSKKTVVIVTDSSVSLTKDHSRMIDGIVRLLQLHGNKMNDFEKNHWRIILCKKYAAQGNWVNFRSNFKQVNKLKFPISSFLLYLAFRLKNLSLLKIQSRISAYNLKVHSYIKRFF